VTNITVLYCKQTDVFFINNYCTLCVLCLHKRRRQCDGDVTVKSQAIFKILLLVSVGYLSLSVNFAVQRVLKIPTYRKLVHCLFCVFDIYGNSVLRPRVGHASNPTKYRYMSLITTQITTTTMTDCVTFCDKNCAVLNKPIYLTATAISMMIYNDRWQYNL